MGAFKILKTYADKHGMTIEEAHSKKRNTRFLRPDKKRACRIDYIVQFVPLTVAIFDTEKGIVLISENDKEK